MARKKQHEEHIDETWLIPYSDLLTLLLALFVVLFAISNVDAAKFEAVKDSMSSAFLQGEGALPDNGNSVLPFPRPTVGPEGEDVTPTPVESSGPGEPDPELQGLFDSLQNYVSANDDLSGNLLLELSEDGVLITLSSEVWFVSGSDELSDKMRDYAEKLAVLLLENQKGKPNLNIVITGHTDTDKVRPGGPFESNWDLSFARAYRFLTVMLSHEEFDPRYFSARGYGEYDPIAPNDTPENKQRNRRVEVLVSLSKDGGLEG